MIRIPCLALLVIFLWQVSNAQRVELTNPLAVDRPPEIVEIPLRQVLSELHLAASQAHTSFPIANKIVAVWDTPQDPTAGRIATALIAAPNQQASAVEAAGHALLEFTRRSSQPFVYYAGSGWSKSDIPTAAAWDDYLKLRLNMLENL